MDDDLRAQPPDDPPTEPVAPVDPVTEPVVFVDQVTDRLPAAPPPEPPAAPAPTPRRRWTIPALVASWLAIALLGGAVGAQLAGGGDDDRPGDLLQQVVGKPAVLSGTSDVVARAAQSVVGIRATEGRQIGQGTGIVLRTDGEVLTNAHVVQGARTVRVLLPGADEGREAQVVATDEREDLALLRLTDTKGLVPAQLGTSSTVRLGDEVLAIGNALGLKGGLSVTRGIVSGLGRSEGALAGLIQTDAALNPGNSGGPLVDTSGRVVGINTAVRGDAESIGFAIAIDHARSVVERLRSGKPAPPVAFLGVATRDPLDGNPGAEVVDVTPGSGAGNAGLRPGDVLVAFDGKPVAGPDELAGLVRDKAPGDKVEVRFRRGDSEQAATVTLGNRPD
jgi:serine protease Do